MARNSTLFVIVLSAIFSSSAGFAPVTTKRANLYNVAARKESELNVNRFQNTPVREPSTSLNMAATEIAVGAIAGTISGGLFSGGLHAIAGPDHLAALLPRCCGQRWYRAGRIGALWGIGHGVSACILGILAFGLKNRISQMGMASKVLSGASHVMEIAVGLSLVVIGLLGIKEAQEFESEPKSLSAAAVEDDSLKKTQKRAVMFNGLLHGFSWDGAPSLAPALAVATWRGNLAFLFSYAVGTMAAMAVTTTLIGEGTRRAGELFNRPDIPQKLSFGSSILAIAIGAIWCGLALK
mmetsp:Transcript_9623/g.12535  ORF Transcript_9623/g.12535 Transcript_9623/m.12535 type:complete len:295 (+) Transcript_9623:123-1007(+)|eukprot:CAMPEP_0195258724 /NCGR_PEP_ID=MMETSP0706-20130129/7557_1 /TAXON_ID=33640 /ORGANISM="Asterionellopsis glacialis, Strain CCMP134" /LENGTH=294 /DNA_ID=CAMNT_0040312123 /DNA_START=72 /DNA_END=956 /DNA_ORIENTATION=+